MSSPTPDPARGEEVVALDRKHVFHSWSAQGALNPMDIAAAEGSYFWDYDGNRYLDLSSQLVNINIGHQHPKVVKAIQEQAAKLATVAPQHANDARGEAARRISELAPPTTTRSSSPTVAPTPSRTPCAWRGCTLDATRCCRRTAATTATPPRRSGSRAIRGVGRTRRRSRGMFTSSARTRTARRSGPTSDEQEAERALQHLEPVIQFEGPQTIAALTLESVVGTAGVLIPPAHYLAGVRELCDEVRDHLHRRRGHGRLRPHRRLVRVRPLRCRARPDHLREGLNSGYVPVGGVIISDEIAATFDERVFPGGLTYSGHPLAAASIVATINAMRDEGIVENAKAIGENVLGPVCASWPSGTR